jgi:class 3 adenylate cyclase
MASMQRRLVAIVHADLADFTRMMEGAETLTFQHLKSATSDVWRPAIEAGGGRLVGIVGDAMLAEFGSTVAAVTAAIDIQARMTRFNETLEESERLLFRIGVHVGEIIVDEEQNIYGDGVNLAARIQALAEPGGIAVSRTVRDVAELQIDCAFVDGGEHHVKNVSRPVHIYHVRPRTALSEPTAPILPQATLRFEGADLIGHKYGFDLALDKLSVRPQGAVVGRAVDQCELVLAHSTVSRRHARLSLVGEALQIEDLGSTNGTAVNGVPARVGAPVPVQVGSKLKIGEVELVVRPIASRSTEQ